MADLKIRNLDDHVADTLRTRAKHRGISLEEEVRQVLTASVASKRSALFKRAAALRAATAGKQRDPALDSARIIREERDVWG